MPSCDNYFSDMILRTHNKKLLEGQCVGVKYCLIPSSFTTLPSFFFPLSHHNYCCSTRVTGDLCDALYGCLYRDRIVRDSFQTMLCGRRSFMRYCVEAMLLLYSANIAPGMPPIPNHSDDPTLSTIYSTCMSNEKYLVSFKIHSIAREN